MTTDLTGATGSHSSHIVICIIIIYYVCCGRLIYRSAFGSCLRVRASEEWEIALTLSLRTTTLAALLSVVVSSSCEKLSSLELVFTPPVLFCCASAQYLCLGFNCNFSFCSCMCLSNQWLTIKFPNCTFLTRSHKNWSGLIRLYFYRKQLADMMDWKCIHDTLLSSNLRTKLLNHSVGRLAN